MDEQKAERVIVEALQERVLNGLVKSDTVSICFTLIGADGSEYEPLLIFNPSLSCSKYTTDEKREKLKNKKIRVTLNKIHPNGRTVQRIGLIGNMTIAGIIVGLTESFERSINEFYPGARFEPSFSEQFTHGINHM